MKFFKEFKDFITRGNVLDMAVGVIVGGAFTTIVKALTNSILMPFIGALVGTKDIKSLYVPLWNATPVEGEVDAYGQQLYTSAIYYGEFIQAIIDFVLIALVLFIIVKVINSIRRRAEKAKEILAKKKEAEQPVVTEEVEPKVTTEEYLEKICKLLESKNEEEDK